MKRAATLVLALFLSASGCFVPSLGALAADSTPKIASLRGMVAQSQEPEGRSAGATDAGAARALPELQGKTDDSSPTLPPDQGFFCYNVTDNAPVTCEEVLDELQSCYIPAQDYCGDTRSDAFVLGQAYCSSDGAPYVALRRIDEEGCTWAFVCCPAPSG